MQDSTVTESQKDAEKLYWDEGSIDLAVEFFKKYLVLIDEADKKYEAWDMLGQAIKYGRRVTQIFNAGFLVAKELNKLSVELYNAREFSQLHELLMRYMVFDRCFKGKSLKKHFEDCVRILQEDREGAIECYEWAKDESHSLGLRIKNYNFAIKNIIGEEKRQMQKLRAKLIPLYKTELIQKIKPLCAEAIDYSHQFRHLKHELTNPVSPQEVSLPKLQEAHQMAQDAVKYVPEDEVFKGIEYIAFLNLKLLDGAVKLLDVSDELPLDGNPELKELFVSYEIRMKRHRFFGDFIHVYNLFMEDFGSHKTTMQIEHINKMSKLLTSYHYLGQWFPEDYNYLHKTLSLRLGDLFYMSIQQKVKAGQFDEAQQLVDNPRFIRDHLGVPEVAAQLESGKQQLKLAIAKHHIERQSDLRHQFLVAHRKGEVDVMESLLAPKQLGEYPQLHTECSAKLNNYRQDLSWVKDTAQCIAVEIMERARGSRKFKSRSDSSNYESLNKTLHTAILTTDNQQDRNCFLINFKRYMTKNKSALSNNIYQENPLLNDFINTIVAKLRADGCFEVNTKFKNETLCVKSKQFVSTSITSIIANYTEKFEPDQEVLASSTSSQADTDSSSPNLSSEEISPSSSQSNSPPKHRELPPPPAPARGRVRKAAPKIAPLSRAAALHPVYGAGQQQYDNDNPEPSAPPLSPHSLKSALY